MTGPGARTSRRPGADVAIEFLQRARLPADRPVRVQFESGRRGTVREVTGIPEHVGSAIRPGGVIEYRYRLAGRLRRRRSSQALRPAGCDPRRPGAPS